MPNHNKAFDDWAKCYLESHVNGDELLWPSETLIRLFKGAYVPELDKSYQGKKVLDVGFGSGNNLFFLTSLGLEVHGTEVDQRILDLVRGKLEKAGRHAELRIGTNRSLPYPDDSFDFLVSWNVVHYEDSEDNLQEALHEYRRVLRPGGRIFISTTGPEHLILTGAKTLGGHRYQIGSIDFRQGQVYFYFDAPNYIHHYFDREFTDVRVGRTHDQLFSATLDWFLVTGVKPAA